MERKPARRVHQVGTLLSNIGEAFGGQRAAFRGHKRTAPSYPKGDWLIGRNNLAQIYADAWSECPYAHCVLDKACQGFSILLYALNV